MPFTEEIISKEERQGVQIKEKWEKRRAVRELGFE